MVRFLNTWGKANLKRRFSVDIAARLLIWSCSINNYLLGNLLCKKLSQFLNLTQLKLHDTLYILISKIIIYKEIKWSLSLICVISLYIFVFSHVFHVKNGRTYFFLLMLFCVWWFTFSVNKVKVVSVKVFLINLLKMPSLWIVVHDLFWYVLHLPE